MSVKRNKYLDESRGILIILVVVYHVVAYANTGWSVIPYTLVFSFIQSFHMPAFFLLSGLLVNTEKWKATPFSDFLKKRLAALAVPYLFFELVAALYLAFALHRQTLLQGLLRMLTMECNVGADWFLPAMFIAQLLFFLYEKWNGSLPTRVFWYGFVAFCFFNTWVLPHVGLYKTLSRGLLAFAFLLSGHLLKRFYEQIGKTGKKPYGQLAVSFAITAVCAAISFLFATNSFYECSVNNPLVFAVGGISGLYFVICFSHIFESRLLALTGQNTLVIMGTHQLVLYTLPASSSVLWVAGTTTLIALIETALIILSNRYFPFLVGKNKNRSDSSNSAVRNN